MLAVCRGQERRVPWVLSRDDVERLTKSCVWCVHIFLVTLSHVLFFITPLSRELGSDSVSLQTETNQELHKGTG